MLQAEYVFFIEHDFNRAISIYKDTLRKNPLYPVFISIAFCNLTCYTTTYTTPFLVY